MRVNKTGRQQRFLEILAAQVTRQQRLKYSDVRIVESPTGLSQDVVMRRAPWCRPVHDRDYAARSDRSAHVGQHRWCLGAKERHTKDRECGVELAFIPAHLETCGAPGIRQQLLNQVRCRNRSWIDRRHV